MTRALWRRGCLLGAKRESLMGTGCCFQGQGCRYTLSTRCGPHHALLVHHRSTDVRWCSTGSVADPAPSSFPLELRPPSSPQLLQMTFPIMRCLVKSISQLGSNDMNQIRYENAHEADSRIDDYGALDVLTLDS
nr:hypothetical protein [Tanacetum cinerariifolium]